MSHRGMTLTRRQAGLGLLTAGMTAAVIRPGWAADSAPDPRALAENVAAYAEATYHDAKRGAALAAAIRAKIAQGTYDGKSPSALAELINQDLKAVLNDGHAMIMAGKWPAGTQGSTKAHQAPHRPDAAELAAMQADNFGIHRVEILRGNVGLIDIRRLYRPVAEVRAQLAAAMSLVAHTSGLILDLTRNIGGDPHMVALMVSYFFDRPPFVVNRFVWRKHPVEEFRTVTDPGGPRYGETRPLALALSKNSFSAAEELAYDLKVLGRAMLIGETTGGGANHAEPWDIDGQLTVFLPSARAENPVTGSNWEGTGVSPDQAVPAKDAVAASHRAILEKLAAGPAGPAKDRAVRALRSEGNKG